MEVKNMVTDNSGQQLLTETKIDSYSMIFVYTFQDFLRWWYIKMPIWHLRRLKRVSTVTQDQLSLGLILSNFFLPWHRDFSAMGYLFGIVMKLLYLPIALIIYLAVIIIYLAFILIWLLLPVGTITLIITSLLK